MGAQNDEIKDTEVIGLTGQGLKIQATVKRLTRHAAVLEIYNPPLDLCVSEVFLEFKIIIRNHAAYSGRAVVRSLVDTGAATVCEVTLDERLWTASSKTGREDLRGEFKEFLNQWQKFYRVAEDYKVVIADIQTFLADLQAWLERVQLDIEAPTAEERTRIENEIATHLRSPVFSALNNMFERFEVIAGKIEPDLQPVHRAFGQRQLHPLLLCAPFIHRTYSKPLGYAGDYEMMNMIVRHGLEGNSLYAKLANAYLLDTPGPQAVRNRVGFLYDRIVGETLRISSGGKIASIYTLACGPAWELQHFLARHPLSDHARLRLLDFNEETLLNTGRRLQALKLMHRRQTPVEMVKNSVQNVLKRAALSGAGEPAYDLIYISGLYDYLNDRVIRALNTYLYDQLAPGGLLVVGNFAPNTPVKNFIEHFLEWFLIYRDSKQLAALAPRQALPGHCHVTAEPTGANIFLEVRKPA